MGLSLEKIEKEASGLLSLAKTAKEQIDASGLQGSVARVALCLDYSGSMSNRYRSGEVQKLAEKALALATQFDDDGEIDIFFFGTNAWHAGTGNIYNYQTVINDMIEGKRMGTTNYAGAIEAVRDFYGFAPAPAKKSLFGRSKPGAETPTFADTPVYVIFETDGVPDNKTAASDALSHVSKYPIFWKFLSVGNENIPFLQKLDDLDNRVIDNADYQPVGDVNRLSDQKLFELLLVEYLDWIKAAQAKGMLPR
jgi:vWA found in TerF C terminus